MSEHYRLSDQWREDGNVEIIVERFEVLRETPGGFWVLSHYYAGDQTHKRWTPKVGARYCHQTVEDAIRHYSIRKQYEQKHLRARLLKSQTALTNIENMVPAVLQTEGYQTFSADRPFSL